MKIKQNVLKDLNKPAIRMRMALDVGEILGKGTSERTIIRWIESNSVMLMTEPCLRFIEKELGITREEILETELV